MATKRRKPARKARKSTRKGTMSGMAKGSCKIKAKRCICRAKNGKVKFAKKSRCGK